MNENNIRTDLEFRIGRAYDAHDLVQQKYREMGFWGDLLTVGIILLGLAGLVSGEPVVGVFLVFALGARGFIALKKMYYRKVYRIED